MTDVLARMQEFAAVVEAAGVRTALDGADVNPPCLLIRVSEVSYRFGRGCVGTEWAGWLYLPDAGQINALRTGLPILETVHGALASAGVALLSATPADFQPPDGGTVPGFILRWTSQ